MQKIVPAILTSDPADLKEKLEMLKGYTNWLHIDVMDGSFVSARSVNLFELGEASEFFNLEIHLMVEDPFQYFEDCSSIRAKRVIFHGETIQDKKRMVSQLDSYEFQKGIALNRETSPGILSSFSQKISSILLMSIEPGAQGRPFDVAALPKAKQIKEMYPNLLLGMDGGIGKENIQSVFAHGVDYAAVGSEIMSAEHPVETLKSLEEMVQ